VKARLLANENIPAPSTALLRSAGVDVPSIAQTHRAISDIEVLKLAREQCRWLLTYDRDYGALVFERGFEPPPAILLLRQESQPATRAAELVLPLLETPQEIEGYFVVVGERALRRRPLRT
jgi:predicted nuclease of predicted toxin-antitoxin system